MGNIHITDGRNTGGKTGSIVCGIIVALFFNIVVAGQVPSIAFKIVFAILSIGSIPIAIFGQNIYRKITDLIYGKNSASVYVSESLIDILLHKFFPAIIAAIVYGTLLSIILGLMFNISQYKTQ